MNPHRHDGGAAGRMQTERERRRARDRENDPSHWTRKMVQEAEASSPEARAAWVRQGHGGSTVVELERVDWRAGGEPVYPQLRAEWRAFKAKNVQAA